MSQGEARTLPLPSLALPAAGGWATAPRLSFLARESQRGGVSVSAVTHDTRGARPQPLELQAPASAQAPRGYEVAASWRFRSPWGKPGPRTRGQGNSGVLCPVAARAPRQEQPGPPGWPPAPRQGGARLAGRQGKGSWVLGLRSSRHHGPGPGRRQRGRAPRLPGGLLAGRCSPAVTFQTPRACLALLHVCTRMHLQCACGCVRGRCVCERGSALLHGSHAARGTR